MATTLQQREAVPEMHPEIPLSPMPDGVEAAFVWQRIEAWTTVRWSPRSVVWIVEGPGLWVAPLQPAVIQTVEKWVGTDYAAVVAKLSPLGGLDLDELAHYRITAEVGADAEVPADVAEAFKRLAFFLASQESATAGMSSYSVNVGPITESWRRDRASVARALEYSGAADVLRRYRRPTC